MIGDVSGRIGDYMLKGWVLTDEVHSGCNIPLMRSPSGRTPVVHFCAKCHDDPESSPAPQSDTASSSTSSTSHFQTASRSSTPPTEVSAALSSPTFAPPPETPESRRRREQSDRASTEIGNRLLKGWAMLAEECPNTQCFGIPLVRPPKPDGEKDPRKECVICGGVYIAERDWAGREHLVHASIGTKEDLEDSTTTRKGPNATTTVSSSDTRPGTMPLKSSIQISDNHPTMDEHVQLRERTTKATPLPRIATQPPASTSSGLSAIDNCAQSLEKALSSLSKRLDTLTDPSAGIINPDAVSKVAEAITKTTEALSRVKELQWKAKQAQ
uniref:Sjogrens syndrome scleroderma autoantigen 1 family protein n=1 Tax=Moniliophthora roreri TaxID=221103 RepID=A0A0W0FCH9_MONRR